MNTYVILSRLTDHGAETIKDHPERVRAVKTEMEALGVHILNQYALFGQFDFLTILEAPDADTILRAVNELAARGSVRVQTFQAMPMDKFVQVFEGEHAAV
jgi:uncharacterized protein with GYD domain